MSISYKTPAYFTDFSCLGSDCEDTCCRNWEVKLDKKHFDMLDEVMSHDDNDKSTFEQYVRLNDNSITSDHDFAFIRMGVNGYCGMLDNEGLCSIHTKFGLDPMGNVCTMFPRMISRCGDTVELSGALSCPEVVRLCINDNKPLKQTRFKTSELPRGKNYPIKRELFITDNDYYSAHFEIVREKMLSIMADEKYALETRLYALTSMANNISSFYHRDCAEVSEEKISSILNDFTQKEFIKNLDLFINEYDNTSAIHMVVAHSILSIKLEQAPNENISQCYQKIINGFDVTSDNHAELLLKKVYEVRENLGNENLLNIDKAVTRYILNCLHREWFVSMPDPFTYIQMLLVRSLLLRTLIYLDNDNNFEKSYVHERVVYVMYNFARNIDQNLDFLKVIYNALSEQTMMTFDFSPAFIRIN